jgi:hypothetical protein
VPDARVHRIESFCMNDATSAVCLIVILFALPKSQIGASAEDRGLSNQDVRPSLVQIEKRRAGIQYHEQHAHTVKRSRAMMSTATYALLLVLLLGAAYWFWTYVR